MMPGLAPVMLLMALLRLLSMPLLAMPLLAMTLLAMTLLAMTLLAMTSAKIKLEGTFADALVLIDAWGEAPLALPSAGSGHGRQNC
ncbi:MAG: hypothetical protein ACOX78_09105 [Lachnospiraceae bacterium]|jgi:hypothetical protein